MKADISTDDVPADGYDIREWRQSRLFISKLFVGLLGEDQVAIGFDVTFFYFASPFALFLGPLLR